MVGKQRQLCALNSEKPKFHRRRHVATPSIVRRITSYINQENPPTVSLMAARCQISVGTTFRTIRDIIDARCRQKKSVHRLYPAIIEKRRSRAWRMYRRLSNENRNKKIEQNDLHPVTVMVWAGVSSHGKTQVYFIEHGATIANKYYIEHIIEPLIEYDIPRLFSDDMQKKRMLHQDSVPGNVTKYTISNMKEHNINVIIPLDSLPNNGSVRT
ncbi:unnamed protein product, partial [Rotaria magnacalcarata]